eukprot:3644014-Heterocapsa_arctica.AAC.1
MDDGQLICHPDHADPVIRSPGSQLKVLGACRGIGEDAKSVARVVGPDAECDAHGYAWVTCYVRHTCRVP